ncbi:DUF4260 domain-containing protein [Emticicia sp. 21SJ11W-3]|uniref:DUF4260 domain-containing protein n=1 Tax=Emticicia sp. 21SJ11W-3 TaxID=2916755 RepID=UPI00209D1C4A|nr:DUF4260 domain-containing protein [Emticicia sp. 21SJ11W-3]UTA66471.1 DUF4260 domain-containing protein [Emticicia sp. 21SJ11W-3]
MLSIILFNQLDFAWWTFPACILLPDLSMIGYAVNTKTGAWIYNFFHLKIIAIAVISAGFLLNNSLLTLAGVILLGHSAMDRMFGYGLKFEDSFKNTYMGLIGKNGKS